MSLGCPSTVMYGYFLWKLSITFWVVSARVGLPHQENVMVTGSVLIGCAVSVVPAVVHPANKAPAATPATSNTSDRVLKRFTKRPLPTATSVRLVGRELRETASRKLRGVCGSVKVENFRSSRA